MSFMDNSDLAVALAKLIRLSNSNTQFDYKIDNFLNQVIWELELDRALLLTLNPVQRLLNPHSQADVSVPRLAPLPLEGNVFERAITSRQTLLASPQDFDSLPPDWRKFLTPFQNFMLVVPLTDDKTSYGVLLLLKWDALTMSPAHSLLIEALSNELSIAVKGGIAANDNRKRLSILNVLSELGRTLSSTIDMDRIMAMVPRLATGVFLADGCTLNVLSEDGQSLLWSSQSGNIPPSCNFERFRGEPCLPPEVARALQQEASFLGFLKDAPDVLELSDKEMEDTVISAPLMFQGRHQGSISLFNKLGHPRREPRPASGSPRGFDNDDLELLFSMNSLISGVIENAITFKEVENLARSNEQMVDYLSTLYNISSAMMTTVQFDELIWIIVQALIHRQGLGFDQVLIFLLERDDAGSRLVSSVFWSYNPENTSDEDQNLAEYLKRPALEEAALMKEKGREMGITIPLAPDSTRILARVSLEKKPLLGFRGFDTDEDMDLRDFGLRAYAAVPLTAKNQEIGVLAVGRFLDGETLTADNLRELTMLANLAGLAIENARLYDDLAQANSNLVNIRERLIEAETAAAQGEMGTQLAHEVRNPLVSIGGFASILLRKMKEMDPLKKYAQVILEEVERVNRSLNNVLDFARNEIGLVRNFKMEDLLDEVLKSARHENKRNHITVVTEVEKNLPMVSGDDRQVMHIFLNLIFNAGQAMSVKGGGKIYLRLYQTRQGDQNYVACDLTDTGPGIAPEVLPNLFTPFFTTKTQGSGLGLAIVKKIVDRYHGLISVSNHPPQYPDGGASFTFMFPEAQGSTGVYNP